MYHRILSSRDTVQLNFLIGNGLFTRLSHILQYILGCKFEYYLRTTYVFWLMFEYSYKILTCLRIFNRIRMCERPIFLFNLLLWKFKWKRYREMTHTDWLLVISQSHNDIIRMKYIFFSRINHQLRADN